MSLNTFWGATLEIFFKTLILSFSAFTNFIWVIVEYFLLGRGSRFIIYSRAQLKYKFFFYTPTPKYNNILWNTFFITLLNKFNCYFLFFMCYNKLRHFCNRNFSSYLFSTSISTYLYLTREILRARRTLIKDGFSYLRVLGLIFWTDSVYTDDEPLWEPIEWSLVMTWILFIFIFAWVAENLITSRYGSYLGRDKRVWFAWFKTFWLLNGWFAISYGTAAMFVILPFYSELVYPISFTFSWWHWYSRVFFHKFISFYVLLLFFVLYTQIMLRWLNWKKLMFLCVVITISLAFLLYTQLVMVFFAYFTDPLWYQKTKVIDYIQLSHEPWKWGWGPAKRDHFSYHKVSTVFWFKNDGPHAAAFMLIQSFFFLSLILLYTYWLLLLRRIYSTKELTLTFYVYCASALRQFLFLFLLFYLCVIISFALNYCRSPIESTWLTAGNTWGAHFYHVFLDYHHLILFIFSLIRNVIY